MSDLCDPHLADQIADYGHMRAIQYTIGDDVSCKDISSRTEKPTYCNGPLKPDTWYHVRVRAFTNGGYTDSNVFVVKTSECPATLISFSTCRLSHLHMFSNLTRLGAECRTRHRGCLRHLRRGNTGDDDATRAKVLAVHVSHIPPLIARAGKNI